MDKADFSIWIEQVIATDYKPKHEFKQAGVLPDVVMQDKAVKALS